MTHTPSREFVQRLNRAVDSVIRVAFVCVLLLSSMYCLLAYLPSTYYAFIQAPFQAWMPVFARMQGYLVAVVLAGVVVLLRKEHRQSAARRLGIEFAILAAAASGYLIWAQPLRHLGNNSVSFLWAIAFLLPVIWAGAMDYQAYARNLTGDQESSRSISFRRVISAAIFIAVFYPGSAFARFYAAGQMHRLAPGEVSAWIWAAITLVLFFLAAFSIIELVARLANRMRNPRRARFVLYTWLAWLGVTVALDRVVLGSIPFSGVEADLYAGTLALAGVTFVGGWILRRRTQGVAENTPAKAAGTLPPNFRETAALVFFLLAAVFTVPAFIGAMDWNSLLEKTWSLVYWTMVAAAFIYRRPAPSRRSPGWALGLLALASLAGYRVALGYENQWPKFLAGHDVDARSVLEQHAAVDASFQSAREILAPSSMRACDAQCVFLRHQTNIQPGANLKLHDLDLVQSISAVKGKEPNIFIVVVDSLRQDYISAYNLEVTFTPAIGRFANDSVVFRNAFTHYGGTTLAEPSIWSGTLLLHKNHVQPFHRVNNLEKLVQADGYQQMISIDTVLRVILQPSQDVVPLDQAAEKWTDVDFCSTAPQTIAAIDQQRDAGKPLFLYTQPQNIHMITLSKTARLRPARKDYTGFVGYYASELERLDGCFGNFVDALKARGLYDDSIIVLTADHGEALQEMGVQRHAFSLKPEVMRVPLIIHVPSQVKQNWYHDSDAVSFNTDVTATLYELLGHGPVIPRPEYGRPLFTQKREELQPYQQDSYLLASSYGPLYGLLYDHGTKLFVENASDDVEGFFDLSSDPTGRHNLLTEPIRRKDEAEVQAKVQSIADLFGYKYKAPTFFDWLMR